MNDREAQAGPGFLFGKIWQEEILLVSRLDANTFIGDFDDDLSQFGLRSRVHPQTTLAIHGLHGIIEDVHKDTLHLLPIDHDPWQGLIKLRQKFDVPMRGGVEQNHVLQGGMQRLALHHRRRQAREVGKFIHHTLEAVHFVHDRHRRLIKNVVKIAGLLKKLLPQPFRRKLDRREWILDLVRNPLSHLLPGRRLLALDQCREIVEDNHRPQLAARLIAQSRSVQPQHQGVASQLGLAFPSDGFPCARAQAFDQFHKHGEANGFEHIAQGQATNLFGLQAQDALGGAIKGRDAISRIHR